MACTRSAVQDLALAGIDGLTGEDLDRLKRQLFHVAWLGETDAEADAVFAAANRRPDLLSDTKRAADWLRAQSQGCPIESSVCVDKGNAALKLNKPLKWWRDTILKGELNGKPEKDKAFQGRWFWTLRDFLDPLNSLDETSEKRGSQTDPDASGTNQKRRVSRKESKESKESQRSRSWVAPDADPDILNTPFEESDS